MTNKYLILIFLLGQMTLFGQRDYEKAPGTKIPNWIKGIKYDKVIAFNVNPNSKNKKLEFENWKIIDTSIVISKRQLDNSQIDTLEKFVFSSSYMPTANSPEAISPYLEFVYYLKNKVVAHMRIYCGKSFYKLINLPVENNCRVCEASWQMQADKLGVRNMNDLCTQLKFNCCKK